jgi:hypothetical protein
MKYDFNKLSNITRETVKKAKLGDALYTVMDVDQGICECCSQVKKAPKIKKLYVGVIQEQLDGGRRLELYKESPEGLKNSRYGLKAEFRSAAVTYYGGRYVSYNKEDLLPELEHELEGNKEMNEYKVRSEAES